MDIDIITQYILAIVPAITAIAGMITTVGVAIAKVKKANKDATAKVESICNDDRALKKQLIEVHKENVELKGQLNEVMARMKHLYFIDKEE